MVTLAVVTGVLTLVVYVALRRVTPVGLGLNPWRYIGRFDARTRFERMLPEPGAVICDAEPPAGLLRGLAAIHAAWPEASEFVGLTRCHVTPPHPALPGIAHVGLLITREHGTQITAGYTWLEPRTYEPARRRARRQAAWRRWLIRLATS